MTFLLQADVSPLDNPAVYSALYDNASSERRAAIDSFRFRKDRNLSLGAAALLDKGLETFGLREKNMSYGRNEYGKPYFTNAPDIHFNISHSASRVVVAFSEREVGCDIEEVTDMNEDVAKRFFSKDEYAWIMAEGNDCERNRAFFKIWTLKESYMKAKGMGLSLPPEKFSVLKTTDFSLHSPYIADGYECALCYGADTGIPVVLTFNF